MLVVSNKHLYSVNEVEEDGFILTVNGEIPVKKGNLVLHNEFGNTKIETNNSLYEGYTSVNEVKGGRKTKRNLSEIEEMYKQSWVSPEIDQYIYGTYELSKNKK
jgi:hypothetical protein